MKTLKNYNQFNEGKFNINGNLKPKSDEEILSCLSDLKPDKLLSQSIEDNLIIGIKQAIEKGAVVTSFDVYNAIEHQLPVEIIMRLCDKCDIKTNMDELLELAIEYEYNQLVRYLIEEKNADPTYDDNFSLRCAAMKNSIDIMTYLLTIPKVDPADYNNGAIKWAAECGSVDAIKLLLSDPRVDPTDDNNQALCTAMNHRQYYAADLLISDKRVIEKLNPLLLQKWRERIDHYIK